MMKRYITTTLPYVNADPHIGHAFELVVADTLARYWRLIGHDVFFNTGTDEHGQKIAAKADEEGVQRQIYVDRISNEFKKLLEGLNLSYDAFIRTTDKRHIEAVQELWNRCNAGGDIYKKKYSGMYCVGCEAFKQGSDLVEGKCPDHQKEPEHIEEENYFFKLSKYQSYLSTYLSKEGVILPEWRRKEAYTFVQKGLEDFSISRDRARLDWGISVPGDDSQVMYVWFDALTNYISTLGWPEDTTGMYTTFWEEGESLQIAGKDQVRFQSIMWQAMLKSAGLPPTQQIVYHGFINSGGQKMSKSLGNVISPLELVRRYGTDATRYLLIRHVHAFDDTDITLERLDEWYGAHLANGLGNLVARTMKMAEDNLDRPVVIEEQQLEIACVEKIDMFRLDEAMNGIFGHVQKGDQYIQDTLPFKKVKSGNSEEIAEGKIIIEKMVRHIYRIAEHLVPFMPETAEKIKRAVKENKKPDTLFCRIE